MIQGGGVEAWAITIMPMAPSQYPKRRLSVRSRKIAKPRDLYLELSDRYEIWLAPRQQCCRCACQISKRYDNLKYQSRGFETLRDLTERRLFGYWDGALWLTASQWCNVWRQLRHKHMIDISVCLTHWTPWHVHATVMVLVTPISFPQNYVECVPWHLV